MFYFCLFPVRTIIRDFLLSEIVGNGPSKKGIRKVKDYTSHYC